MKFKVSRLGFKAPRQKIMVPRIRNTIPRLQNQISRLRGNVSRLVVGVPAKLDRFSRQTNQITQTKQSTAGIGNCSGGF